MATHNLDHQPTERLITEIADLKRQVSELRTLQLTSANGLQIVGYPEIPSQIDTVVTAGSLATFNYQLFPEGNLLTNWDFYFTVYVDLPSYPTLDLAYRYQYLKSKIRVTNWPDWNKSADNTGMRWFNINIENYDTISHHVYIAGKFYGPYALQGSSTP